MPYSPQFNGIELVFSQLKAAYKKKLLAALIDNFTPDRVSLIHAEIEELDQENIVNCIRKGLNEVYC